MFLSDKVLLRSHQLCACCLALMMRNPMIMIASEAGWLVLGAGPFPALPYVRVQLRGCQACAC